MRFLHLKVLGEPLDALKEQMQQAQQRGEILWGIDQNAPIRFSHENPEVQAMYNAYFHKPLSQRSHELLHLSLIHI